MALLDNIIPRVTFDRGKQQPQQPEFDPNRLGPKEVYMTWEALSRPTQKFLSPKLMRTFAIIGIFVALLLVILQEYFLILVIVSMLFVSQTLAKTPPQSTRYELSSYGVHIDDQTFYWHEMRRFFFYEQEGMQIMAVDLLNGFPTRLFLTLRRGDEGKVKGILEQRMQYLETEPETLLDKTYKSIADKFTNQ